MDNCREMKYIYDKENKIEIVLSNLSKKSYALHNHVSVCTIGIILQGSIILTMSDEKRQYVKDETFAIPPYVPHGILTVEPYSMISICIDKTILQKLEASKVYVEIVKLLKHIGQYQKISAEMRQQIKRYLELFSRMQMKQYQQHPQSDCVIFKEALKQELEVFPENKLNIEEMARMTSTSKYHFIRCFKKEIGLTPHQFQMQNRVRKAQKLLSQTDSMTKVAMDTGFCDQSHFIKQFEKIVGLTPSDYKRAFSIL